MNVELIMACLGIMVKGMIGIFIVILVIWSLVALLGRLTAEKAAAKDAPAPAKSTVSAPAQEENMEALVVAASVVLAEELGTDVAGLRIVSFKKCAE